MKKISLTQGKFALVDDEDFERVNQFKWCAYKCYYTFYAMRGEYKNGRWRSIHMHRFILNAPKNKVTDHKDKNGLNNQKYNIRICSVGQNNCNVKKQKNSLSKYKGVMWRKSRQKWIAVINYKGKAKQVGTSDIEKECAVFYNLAARRIHGKFACPNIIL